MTQPTHPEPDYQPANKEGDQKRLPKRTEDQMSTVSNLTRNSWRSLAPDEHHKCTHLSRFALPSWHLACSSTTFCHANMNKIIDTVLYYVALALLKLMIKMSEAITSDQLSSSHSICKPLTPALLILSKSYGFTDHPMERLSSPAESRYLTCQLCSTITFRWQILICAR